MAITGIQITVMREKGTLPAYVDLLDEEDRITLLRLTLAIEVAIYDMSEQQLATPYFEAYLSSIEFPDVPIEYYPDLGIL